MDIFRLDSPFMNTLRAAVDILILDILCIICCIPIITIGAALSAKYYVAMKMLRDEEGGIFESFFKAFARNFKQATVVWLIQLIILFLIFIDWYYIYQIGFNNAGTSYLLSIILISAIFMFVNMVAYPLIARFKLSYKELYKGVFVFIFSHFFALLAILALMIICAVAVIWYFSWLPLILVFASVATTYFIAALCDKNFRKVEEANEDLIDKNTDEVSGEYDESLSDLADTISEGEISEEDAKLYAEIEAKEALANSYAGSRRALKQIADVSDKSLEEDLNNAKSKEELDAEFKERRKLSNRIKNFFTEEKSKLSKLSGKQKARYLVDYYLPGVIGLAIFIGFAGWYASDVYKAKQLVLSGGLVNCPVSEEGITYSTTEYAKWADLGKKRASLVDTDLNVDSSQEYDIQTIQNAFIAQVAAGYYDYLLIGEEAIDFYAELEFFVDVTEVMPDLSYFDSDALYFYNGTPVGIKLTDDVKAKLGLNDDNNYYITYVSIGSDISKTKKFTTYLFDIPNE